MCLIDCSVCAIRCIAFLWRAIRSPFMWGCEHLESKCGHVSMTLLGHSVKFGFGCMVSYLGWISRCEYWRRVGFGVDFGFW